MVVIAPGVRGAHYTQTHPLFSMLIDHDMTYCFGMLELITPRTQVSWGHVISLGVHMSIYKTCTYYTGQREI